MNMLEAPIFQNTLKIAIERTIELAKEQGITNSKDLKGFTIDSNYCDWHELQTGALVGVIDDFGSQFGAVGSENYEEVVDLLCEKLTEHFAN